ncbi:MAG: arginine--tRNA ligase [Bacteroidota bacterium]|jgi:arginyl-tRNA synthetase|nr:arginine--tRNA ligase [Bacteroidota bacterium]
MKDYLKEQIARALSTLDLDPVDADIQFEKPKIAEHGDLSTNIAMVLARPARKNPRQIAEQLVAALRLDSSRIAAVEIAGPGFINFRFAEAHLSDALSTILRDGNAYGRSDEHAGKTVNVEWVSANPTGPLHAGHGRQVCIGATICALLEWTGWTVTREYYFNNAGNQMNNLAISIRERYLGLLGDAISEENILYAGEYIRDIAQAVIDEHGASKRDAPLDFFRKQGEERCFAMIRHTLDRLGVFHDVFYNEDSLYSEGKIDEVLAALRHEGVVYDKDDAVWLKTTAFGADKDRVIIKSSGEPTYRLPDIAYHREKIRRGYDRIIDIFGADHIATIPDVLAAVKTMDLRTDHIDVIIHQMVSFVHDGEAVKMSKRSGNVYSLDDLIDDVGVDAVRLFFIMRGANSHLEFDIKLAQEQSENNPVYYLQYAHARIASILRFAASEGMDTFEDVNLALLTHDSEIALIKELMRFPEWIAISARTCETQHLCTYLHNCATAFHKFYHDCRVVTDDRALSTARLALCRATMQVLRNGFSIIGIDAPEKM